MGIKLVPGVKEHYLLFCIKCIVLPKLDALMRTRYFNVVGGVITAYR